jgi:predicted nucleic acid-binding protein
MRLVIDASVAVTEALRSSGRQLLQHAALELFASARVKSETAYELRRRTETMVTRGHLSADDAMTLLSEAERTITNSVAAVLERVHVDRLRDATWRISRDPDDAPTIALALVLDCGIWTSDRDFFGCGLPVWSTEVVQAYLCNTRKASGARTARWNRCPRGKPSPLSTVLCDHRESAVLRAIK